MRSITRKLSQVIQDPVLRRYLWNRVCGRVASHPILPAGSLPPYLNAPPGFDAPIPPWKGAATAEEPLPPLVLRLPGQTVTLTAPCDAFAQTYADVETEAALHRFAWAPLTDSVSPAWMRAMWLEWKNRFGRDESGLAWEAYTAAERVCNLLDWTRRGHLVEPPEDLAAALAAHADKIMARLEYHGETATHNHLANNGRGLYRLGVELAIPQAADIGLTVLTAEADRLLTPSGWLREGSSHYHLLYLRNYADCWLTARRGDRPETQILEKLVTRMAAVLPSLALPGPLPLIGDISPDSPPDYVTCLLPGRPRDGWLSRLPAQEADALCALLDQAVAQPCRFSPANDGLMRLDHGDWSALVWAQPGGWSHYPGHGHQDLGGFELHHKDTAVIVDPGRGGYGDEGEAGFYRSAQAHNGLTLEDFDPYPANKPYYDDDFRRAAAGNPPIFGCSDAQAWLEFDGYHRYDTGTASRRLTMAADSVAFDDALQGGGRRTVVRRFHTPLDVRLIDGHALLGERFRIRCPGAEFRLEPRIIWSSYGCGNPGHAVVVVQNAALPWAGRTIIEVA